MLVLDCSSSLGSQFAVAQSNAKDFINTLYSASQTVNSGGGNNNNSPYEYVDLGLSVNWATYNVGATKPEEYGDYYAWGETETKSDYNWSTYKYCNGSNTSIIKYCGDSSYGYNGFTDGKTTLDIEDDVAHVKWGGSWRMPTKEEFEELKNNCTWTRVNQNDINGYLVTSNIAGYTDCSIFLPWSGFTRYSYHSYIWTSTLVEGDKAWEFCSKGEGGSNTITRSRSRCNGISVRPVMPKCIEHEYVDLGLTVKWATCNVGATKPEEYGDYYAWGETETKDTYDWSTYKWCNGSYSTLTKYNTNSSCGAVDNKSTLDPEDDVAHVKWGGSWRMPTKAEIDELCDKRKCDWSWTSVNGVVGYMITSKISGYEGNYIFMPAMFYGSNSSGNLYFGVYWTKSNHDNPKYQYDAYDLYIDGQDFGWSGNFRCNSYYIRPVCP